MWSRDHSIRGLKKWANWTNVKSLGDLERILNQEPKNRRDEVEIKDALRMEYEYRLYSGQAVPQKTTDKMWTELMNESVSSRRQRLWENFALKEEETKTDFERRKTRAENRRKRMEEEAKEKLKGEFDGRIYDERGVSLVGAIEAIIPKIDPYKVRRRHKQHLSFAFDFGQPLVFDLGLPYPLTKAGLNIFRQRLKGVYAHNLSQWEPFDIHLCNVAEPLLDPVLSSYTWKTSSSCFTDLFPIEKIVYLSPESKHVLKEYKHDDVYVVAAFDDGRDSHRCLSLARIKELGLRSARLDVETFFTKRQKPNFNINQMLQVLTDARDTGGNWLYAFRHFGQTSTSPVVWRPKFSFMETKEEEEELEEETHIKKDHKCYVNERPIFKPRQRFEGKLRLFR